MSLSRGDRWDDGRPYPKGPRRLWARRCMSRQAFELAAEERESGQVLEGLAKALHLAFDYPGAMDAYERAYAAYRREGGFLGAARADPDPGPVSGLTLRRLGCVPRLDPAS